MKVKLYTLCEVAYFAALVYVTVNWVGPVYLNADQIINSAMSLQHLTIFYWGQNRLASLLPLLAAPIRNPEANLAACIIISASAFFGLLWIFANSLAYDEGDQSRRQLVRLSIFSLTAAIFLASFKQSAIYEIVIGHYEYGLSYLSLLAGFHKASKKSRLAPIDYLLNAVLLFTAIGLNTSTAITALALSLWLYLFSDTERRYCISAAIVAVISGSFWMWISVFYPHSPTSYSQFDLRNIVGSFEIAATHMLEACSLAGLTASLVFLAAIASVSPRLNRTETHRSGNQYFQLASISIFGLVWICFFACNSWVILNDRAFRYFIPSFYCLLLIASVIAFQNFRAWPVKRLKPLIFLIASGTFLPLLKPFVPLGNYSVFQAVPSQVSGQVSGFAGDYWSVWPGMVKAGWDHRPVFGFGYRSFGNENNLKNYFLDPQKYGKSFAIACMHMSIEGCSQQLSEILGNIKVIDPQKVSEGIKIIKVEPCFYKSVTTADQKFSTSQKSDEIATSTTQPPLCDPQVKSFKGEVTERQAKEIRLKLGTIVSDPEGLKLPVTIFNGSSEPLNTVSGDGKPVRLSWRLVAAEPVSARLTSEGWDGARQNLEMSLNPGESATTNVRIKPPEVQGKYLLQVAIVQEGVRWFQNAGMPIPNLPITISPVSGHCFLITLPLGLSVEDACDAKN